MNALKNDRYDLLILGSGSTAFAAAIHAQELGKTAVMTELVRMYNMRQMVRNEQERIPAQGAQKLLYIFVAEVCMGFSKAWNPHPSFFSG